MNKFLRYAALATLAAFLGLAAVETFHQHQANQTDATCSVCQITQSTPAHLSTTTTAVPQALATRAPTMAVSLSYHQFVFFSHGLSPPIAA